MATITQFTTYSRAFFMKDAADPTVGKTGLTIALTISKAGAAFAAPAGTVSEIGSGWYKVVLTNVDTNTAGDLIYHATATGADDADFTDQVMTQEQSDAVHIGTTANYAPTRNALIEMAYSKARVIDPNQTLEGYQLTQGIGMLNLIIRQMDAEPGAKPWAINTGPTSLVLQEHIGIYTSSEALPTDMVELTSVTYRSGYGKDTFVHNLPHSSYESLPDKFATGDPKRVYLNVNRNLAVQSLYVWPLPVDVGTQTRITGSDQFYLCIRSHVADSTNYPATGANWRLFWVADGVSGAEGSWASGTTYTAPKILRLWYKRPLADFTSANDNPDLPPSLSRILLYRLAADLSIDTGKSAEFEKRLRTEADSSERKVWRSTRKETATNYHNKADYF